MCLGVLDPLSRACLPRHGDCHSYWRTHPAIPEIPCGLFHDVLHCIRNRCRHPDDHDPSPVQSSTCGFRAKQIEPPMRVEC